MPTPTALDCDIGLVSDTHGLLRPETCTALQGCSHIVHAGDIGDPAILTQLARIAPVTAVRGNNDRGTWAQALAESEFVQVGECFLYVLHDLALLDLCPVAAGVSVVVSGHSHRPSHEIRDGVHFINPGSAGPRRFRLPISLARLRMSAGAVTVDFIDLETGDSP